jgi:signal transduction histidine kinase
MVENGGSRPRWSAKEEPREVLPAFCREFMAIWTRLATADRPMAQVARGAGRGCRQAIDRVRTVLLSLESLIADADQYIAQYTLRHLPPQSSELSILANAAHDLKVSILAAKAFSELLIQSGPDGVKPTGCRESLEERLNEINQFTSRAFPLMLSGRDYLEELGFGTPHRPVGG